MNYQTASSIGEFTGSIIGGIGLVAVFSLLTTYLIRILFKTESISIIATATGIPAIIAFFVYTIVTKKPFMGLFSYGIGAIIVFAIRANNFKSKIHPPLGKQPQEMGTIDNARSSHPATTGHSDRSAILHGNNSEHLLSKGQRLTILLCALAIAILLLWSAINNATSHVLGRVSTFDSNGLPTLPPPEHYFDLKWFLNDFKLYASIFILSLGVFFQFFRKKKR